MKKIALLFFLILVSSYSYAQKGRLKKDQGSGGGSGGGGSTPNPTNIVEVITTPSMIKLNPAVELDMSYVSQPQFTFQTVNDYDNGITLNDICNVKIKATAAWTLTVQASAANFTHTGNGSTVPAAILKLKTSSLGSFQTISTTPVSLASGTKGTNTHSGNFFSLSYQANPGYNYNGATYNINLIYTLTAQ